MKATELRIGNIIGWRNYQKELKGSQSCVSTIHDDSIIINDIVSLGAKELEGIPLTEEWLIKFGFEKTEYWYDLKLNYSVFNHKIQVELDQEKCWVINERFDAFIVVKECKYVHQLQNLYFSLCGEELKIKE